ncbi:MAG: TIGR04282 family arsenosugar biosynthesis glycosyltransferase [Pseudohongiellaceae bacterium]
MKTSPVRHPDTLLLLFAREPVTGRVKTRLQPALGEADTLRLHEDLTRHMARTVAGSGQCQWRFCVAGDPTHPLFTALTRSGNGLPPLAQQGEDLGERMHNAVHTALAGHEQVILLGADCASVDASYLEQAVMALRTAQDVVLGPAEDGGYVLLGLKSDRWPLFADMPWGTASVVSQTRERLRGASACWSELPPRWDVDRPEDLGRLAGLPQWLGDSAPPVV